MRGSELATNVQRESETVKVPSVEDKRGQYVERIFALREQLGNKRSA